MAKLKKPIPSFKSEEEEAEYWDKHSLLEHFDESDFSPLQVKTAKDRPIAIRLDSESRQKLEDMAKAYGVGPSTLARTIISSMLQRWEQSRQMSITLEDAAGALFQPIPDDVKEEMVELFTEAKIGKAEAPYLYIFNAPDLERVSRRFFRYLVEATGVKIKPDDEAYEMVSKKLPVTRISNWVTKRKAEDKAASSV